MSRSSVKIGLPGVVLNTYCVSGGRRTATIGIEGIVCILLVGRISIRMRSGLISVCNAYQSGRKRMALAESESSWMISKRLGRELSQPPVFLASFKLYIHIYIYILWCSLSSDEVHSPAVGQVYEGVADIPFLVQMRAHPGESLLIHERLQPAYKNRPRVEQFCFHTEWYKYIPGTYIPLEASGEPSVMNAWKLLCAWYRNGTSRDTKHNGWTQ